MGGETEGIRFVYCKSGCVKSTFGATRTNLIPSEHPTHRMVVVGSESVSSKTKSPRLGLGQGHQPRSPEAMQPLANYLELRGTYRKMTKGTV